MKRLIGGQFLLDLTGISLGLTSGEVSITDAGVLAQLLELRNFIDEKRDFTKGFKDLKPVLVQYRSSASKIDGVVPCNLSFNTDALHLSVAGYSVQADGTPITLRINVVYEFTSYVGYTIKTAKLDASNNLPIFENIIDKNGNNRFIEGEIDLLDSVSSDVTKDYGKWSLSGSHLLIVLGITIADATTITGALSKLNLPDWIVDKIVPLAGNNVIYKPGQYAMGDDSSVQQITHMLTKLSDGIYIYSGSLTTTAIRHTRFQFDLLIDDEEIE